MAPGVEFTDLNWLAIVLAILANIVIGFIWYAKWMPTGRIWMRHMGVAPDAKPPAKEFALAMALMVVGSFLTMFVLAHDFVAYRDAYDLDAAGSGYELSVGDGLLGGFFTWLGFYLPPILGTLGWERKPLSLAAVNAGYYLVSLLVAGAILALM